MKEKVRAPLFQSQHQDSLGRKKLLLSPEVGNKGQVKIYQKGKGT
jgi:hypothetical protein